MSLRPATLLAYAAPSLPLAAMYFPVYVFLAPYWAETHGLALGLIGAVFVAVRLFDAVSDPAMGWISDRMPTRFGRRRPWIAVGCPLVMAGAWALFAPPPDAGAGWFVAALFGLTLGWTIMLTPWYAWGAELSGDYAERARITLWRDAVGLSGTILAAVLYSAFGEDGPGLAAVAVLIVAGLPLATLWCLAAVPEPRDWSRAGQGAGTIFAALRAEPLFGRLLAAYLVNGAANALPAALFLFFVEDRLGAPGWGGPLLVLYFGAAVAAAPLWSRGLRVAPKHRLWCGAMLYASAVFACALLLGEGDVWAFAAICVLTGAALGADLALPSAMQADLVDLDTARSGRQRTGAFFALWSLATKVALAAGGGAALVLVDWAGFEAGAENDATALLALGLLYAGAPVALKLLAVAMMWRFPLDAAQQARLRADIEGAEPRGA